MNKKNMIIGVAVLIGGFVVYKLISKPKATLPSNNDGGGTDGGIVVSDGSTPSKGLNYLDLSNSLFDAFDGYGTDNTAVYDTFGKLKNEADMLYLIKAYGIRTISSGRGNFFVKDYTGDLFGSIKSEMDTSEIATINQILTNKGIKTLVS